MKPLTGKVAIVTGASRGIGKQIALQLADLGASVTINYANSSKKAEEVVKEIKEKGGEAAAVQANLSQVSEVEQLFHETIETFGKVNILVNNVGVMIKKPLTEVTEADYTNQFDVNVKGTLFACQNAMKYMEQEGRIVNLSTSVNGQMFPSYSVYAGTKGAVEQFTRSWQKNSAPSKLQLMQWLQVL